MPLFPPEVGAGGGAVVLLQTEVASGSSPSLTFSSISGAYNHIVLKLLLRSSASGPASDGVIVTFNGLTASYEFQGVTAAHTTLAGASNYNQSDATAGALLMPAAGGTASEAGAFEIEIDGYAEPNFYKTATIKGGFTQRSTSTSLQRWVSTIETTAAITEIEVASALGDNLVAGSTGWLYGIE